jgi:hypothetical protein
VVAKERVVLAACGAKHSLRRKRGKKDRRQALRWPTNSNKVKEFAVHRESSFQTLNARSTTDFFGLLSLSLSRCLCVCLSLSHTSMDVMKNSNE